jgi:hypothetical protein
MILPTIKSWQNPVAALWSDWESLENTAHELPQILGTDENNVLITPPVELRTQPGPNGNGIFA